MEAGEERAQGARSRDPEREGPRPAADPAQVAAICREHDDRPDALIEILHAIQTRFGFVPETAVPAIADSLNLTRADVHGVLTYYSDFRREPPGRHVLRLCRAEACQARGAERLAAHLTTMRDNYSFTLSYRSYVHEYNSKSTCHL